MKSTQQLTRPAIMKDSREQRLNDAVAVLLTPEVKETARTLAAQFDTWSIFWSPENNSVTLDQENVSVTIE